MNSRGWSWALGAMLLLVPGMAWSQCMGGSGSAGQPSHRHESGTRSEKKTRETIQRLLADGSSRVLVMEVVLADRELMRDLITRIAGTPEWRALARERMGADVPAPGRAHADSVGTTKPQPAPDAVAYTCPMHPEIRSARPGACPKCGMSLERVRPDTERKGG